MRVCISGLRTSWLLCVAAVLLGVSQIKGGLLPSGAHVCSRTTNHSIPFRQSYTASRSTRTTVRCGDVSWVHCTIYKRVYSVAYRVVNKIVNKTVYFCCTGWSEQGSGCPVPICSQGCIKGRCVSPDKCSCEAGYHGPSCEEVCPPNKYGMNCNKSCQCQNSAPCDSRTGICNCTSGWMGQHCDRSPGKDLVWDLKTHKISCHLYAEKTPFFDNIHLCVCLCVRACVRVCVCACVCILLSR